MNGIVLENFLVSDNLNECVDFLLKKTKINHTNIKAIIRHNVSSKNKEKQRRLRKNREQHEILLNIYKNNTNWDKALIQRLSDKLGLKES